MSCPVLNKSAAGIDDPELNSVLSTFEALLPNCDKPLASLNACRERVVKEGKGHCEIESKCWTACYGARQHIVQAITKKCGGTSGHRGVGVAADCVWAISNIQTRLMECAKNSAGAVSKAECLKELNQFLSCAKEVATAGFPMQPR